MRLQIVEARIVFLSLAFTNFEAKLIFPCIAGVSWRGCTQCFPNDLVAIHHDMKYQIQWLTAPFLFRMLQPFPHRNIQRTPKMNEAF